MTPDAPQPLLPKEAEEAFIAAFRDCLAHAPDERLRYILTRGLVMRLAVEIMRDEDPQSVATLFRDLSEGVGA